MKNEKAFPCQEIIFNENFSDVKVGGIRRKNSVIDHAGMDLRDYFAVHADISDYKINEAELAFKMTGKEKPSNYPQGIESVEFSLKLEAALKYMYADAMMEARNEKTKDKVS